MITVLKNEILKVAGHQLKTPRDFIWLSRCILEKSGERISPTTLKRMFGYLREPVKPRSYTLDVLSRFIGYDDFSKFCENGSRTDSQSNILQSNCLPVNSLEEGKRVRLTWKPDRVCVIRHLGEGHFEVEESVNSKLCVGDTFECHLFIVREPLYISNLVRDGMKPMSYVAGRRDGIMFEVL